MNSVLQGVCVVSEILAVIIAKKIKTKKKKVSNRREWVRRWVSRRKKFGVSQQLCQELRNEDIPSFKNFFRMSPDQFDVLLQKVQPFILS